MDLKEQTMEELAEHIRIAQQRVLRSHDEWVDAVMELTMKMAEARSRFPDNRMFSHWLVDHDLDSYLNKDERAALIAMAVDPELARIVLEETERFSFRYIYEKEFKARKSIVRHVANTAPIREPEAQVDVKPANLPAEVISKPIEAPVPISAKGKIADRMDELMGLFESKHAKNLLRKCFEKASGKSLAVLMAASVDEGFLGKNSVDIREAGLRIVFPPCVSGSGGTTAARYAATFDLTKPADRKRFEEDVWPAVMANKNAYLADPTKLEDIVRNYGKERRRQEMAQVIQAKTVEAIKQLPTSEREVMMFGEVLWPRVDERNGTYQYHELKTAVLTFRDLWRWMWKDDPKGRAIQVRQSVRWYTEHADATGMPPEHTIRKVWQLIHVLARLGEVNPNGECKYPE